MNKKIVPILVILLLVAGGGYYLTTRNAGSGAPQTVGQAAGEAAEFAKAMESGKPTLCTMTKGADKMEYLIKGKKMRANITTVVEGKTTLSHMINDEQFFYMWVQGEKNGTKMSAVVPSPSASDLPGDVSVPKFESETDYEELKNEGYTIVCQTGGVEDTDFVPPADVSFIDPSAMLNAIPSPGADGTIDMQKLQELQEQYGGTE